MVPKEMKYNLHYGNVRGDVLLPPLKIRNFSLRKDFAPRSRNSFRLKYPAEKSRRSGAGWGRRYVFMSEENRIPVAVQKEQIKIKKHVFPRTNSTACACVQSGMCSCCDSTNRVCSVTLIWLTLNMRTTQMHCEVVDFRLRQWSRIDIL